MTTPIGSRTRRPTGDAEAGFLGQVGGPRVRSSSITGNNRRGSGVLHRNGAYFLGRPEHQLTKMPRPNTESLSKGPSIQLCPILIITSPSIERCFRYSEPARLQLCSHTREPLRYMRGAILPYPRKLLPASCLGESISYTSWPEWMSVYLRGEVVYASPRTRLINGLEITMKARRDH